MGFMVPCAGSESRSLFISCWRRKRSTKAAKEQRRLHLKYSSSLCGISQSKIVWGGGKGDSWFSQSIIMLYLNYLCVSEVGWAANAFLHNFCQFQLLSKTGKVVTLGKNFAWGCPLGCEVGFSHVIQSKYDYFSGVPIPQAWYDYCYKQQKLVLCAIHAKGKSSLALWPTLMNSAVIFVYYKK